MLALGLRFRASAPPVPECKFNKILSQESQHLLTSQAADFTEEGKVTLKITPLKSFAQSVYLRLPLLK